MNFRLQIQKAPPRADIDVERVETIETKSPLPEVVIEEVHIVPADFQRVRLLHFDIIGADKASEAQDITVTAASVLTLVATAMTVYKEVQSIRYAGDNLDDLCNELRTLTDHLESIDSGIKDSQGNCLVLDFINADVWKNINSSIDDIRELVDKVETHSRTKKSSREQGRSLSD